MTLCEIHNFLWSFMFIFQGLLPVLGLLILIFEVKVEKRFLILMKILIPIAGTLYFLLGEVARPRYPCHNLVLFYSLVMTIFLHFLQLKNPDKTTKVLGIFLMVSHLFSQYWEIPVFVAGHLNILGGKYLGSIDQLYLILVFYLAFKYANIPIDKKTIVYLLTPLIFSAIAFCVPPIGSTPMPLGYVVRAVSCFFLGKIFIDRSVL